jgi:XRE family transcriptional regulator, regulator of sulfur utilization
MDNDMKLREAEISAMKYVKAVKEFWSHVAMYVTFAAAFLLTVGPDNAFVLWGAVGWGIGVLVHGLIAYEVINIFTPAWERKLIERRLARKP